MNPRTTLRAILGWCPGFESASRFLPDKEISNRRIAISLTVLIITATSTFIAAETLLEAAGFPSEVSLEIRYDNPVIRVKDGRIYLAVAQKSRSTEGAWLGPPSVNYLTIYFSELLENGTLRNRKNIEEVEGGANVILDLLPMRSGGWVLAYGSNRFTSFRSMGWSPLYLVTSSDGETWRTPTEIYNKPLTITDPSLVEAEGKLFVEFKPQNEPWLYTFRQGETWAQPMPAPFSSAVYEGEFNMETAFVDKDGGVGVVWDESDKIGVDLGIKYSKLVNGSWSEPKPLSSDSIQLLGQEPRIMYSGFHGGYFLFVKYVLQRGDPGWSPVVQVFFSSDWMHWESRGSFKASDYSITEFTDGDLGLVYQEVGNNNLYYVRSVDGSNWSSPQLIEVIRSGEILLVASKSQRISASYVITLLVSIAILVALTRWSFSWLS
jgi:hypothetical protein